MKRLLTLLSLLMVVVFGSAQQIKDSTSLRNQINKDIVPNMTKSITAAQMNRILQGNLNLIPRYAIDSVRKVNDSIFVRKDRQWIFAYKDTFGGSGSGSGTVEEFFAGNLSPLFTTSVADATVNPNLTFNLSNAPANTVFGRKATLGQPSYIGNLDSLFIPDLHSESYYNSKYITINNGLGCVPRIEQTNFNTLRVYKCPDGYEDFTLEVTGGADTVNHYYYSNDTTVVFSHGVIIVCDTISSLDPLFPDGDSIICRVIQDLDTVILTTGPIQATTYQNGLKEYSPKVVEQGGFFNRPTEISGLNIYDFGYKDLNFYVRGQFGLGQPITTYTNSQFLFNPRKGAILAGINSHGQWTDENIGGFTQNFGVNNLVPGHYSFSSGISNYVPGYVNTVHGEDNQVLGNRSFVTGQGGTLASASYNSTIAGGFENLAWNHYGLTSGFRLQNYTYAGTVLGQYNDTIHSKARQLAGFNSTYDVQGQAFSVGNGTGPSARSNAITVFNDEGATVIGDGTYRPGAQLELTSATKALGVNRGTTAQMLSIPSPYDGMIYANTDSLKLMEYYAALGWVSVDRFFGSGGSGSGVTIVSPGNGMSFSPITTTGPVHMGTPISVTLSSTNGFVGSGHTHDFDPGGLSTQYIRGDGTLAEFPESGLTLGPVGSTPNANAATLTGSVLNLQPASNLHPGVVTTSLQYFQGSKRFLQDIYVNNSTRLGRGVSNVPTNFVWSAEGGANMTTAFQNLIIGYYAGEDLTTGSQNIFQGYQAGMNTTVGGGNVAIGSSALKQNISGNYNIAIGPGAMQNALDDGYSVAIGAGALGANVSPFRNTAVGNAAMADAQPDAYDNAAFGFNALRYLTTGQKNTALGSAAGENLRTGYQNTLAGQDAGLHLNSGYWNNALGWLALSLNQHGHSNTGIGTSTQRSVSAGNRNIAIGTGAMYGAGQLGTVNNSIAIGNDVVTTADNQIKIGNTDHNAIHLRGTLYWDEDPGTATWVLTSQGPGLPAVWAPQTGGGGGGGSVTQVNTGYGITGGPITTIGTVTFDSATVFQQLINTLLLTTNGTSGPATLDLPNRTLNIPNYATGGGGGIAEVQGTLDRVTVTDGTTLPIVDIASTYVGQTSITTLGIVGTGTWQGTSVKTNYGGTGLTSVAAGSLLVGQTSGTSFTELPIGPVNYILTSNGSAPTWVPLGPPGPLVVPISALQPAIATNTIDNGGYIQDWRWGTLADNYGLKLSTNSTTADDSQTLLGVIMTGTNAGANKETYAAEFRNTHDGSGAVNHGIYVEASGADVNRSIIAIGNMGINNLTPLENLSIGSVGVSTATVGLLGITSGKVILKVADAAGTWTGILPTDGGADGEVLHMGAGNQMYWDVATGVAQDLTLSGTTTGIIGLTGGSTPTVTVVGAGINTIGVSGTTITVTGTEVDGVIGNEYQDYTSTTAAGEVTWGLTNSLSTFKFIAGTNTTFDISGTSGERVITINSAGSAGGLTNVTGTDDNGFDLIVTTPSAGVRDIEITTTLNVGSVPFIGTGGALLQDNNELFWDNTNKYLGIGTSANPAFALHVIESSAEGYAASIENSSDGGNGLQVMVEGPGDITTFYGGTGGSSARFTFTGLGELIVAGSFGSANQVLKSGGAGASVSWVDANTLPITTNITAGAGMNFTAITNGTGGIAMGTPSDVTLSSTNSASGNTHTHAFEPGGTTAQYIDGTGALQTFPTTSSTSISNLTIAEDANTINNANYLQEWQWGTLTVGPALKISSSSTTAVDGQTLFEVALAGANATTELNTFAGKFSNTHTGDGVNTGIQVTATGGATNTGISVTGTERSIHAIGTMEVEGSFILETGGAPTTISSAGNWSWTLPPNNGDANQALLTDGNGVSIWGTVDISNTNEIQTFNNTSDATSHTVTLSGPNGSLKLAESSYVTLTTTGTALDGIVTIGLAGSVATYDGSGTFSNKGIDLTDNTFTGTLAEFNTAMTDADFVSIAGTETLTNKTLTSPVINSPTGIVKGDVGLGNVDNTSDATKNAAAVTLTNKTFALGSNTFSGTTAQFNTALTDADFATLDASSNVTMNNALVGYTTTATAAGTTTLTVGSTQQQYFTGATTQTVTLPAVSTLALGHRFRIVNNSTGAVTVNSSGGNAVVVLAGGTEADVTSILTTGTSAASWSQYYNGSAVASGKKLTVSNTLTLAGTDGSTLNIGAGGTLGSNAYTSTAYAPIASPTFTGTVTIPTPFTLGATSVTTTGTQLNYLNAATGTTGTTSTNIVFSTSPTLVTPNLGTPSAVTLTNATGLPLSTGVTGTLPVANGGTGATTLTGLLQGNGTGAITAISNSSTVGQVLRVTGASTYAWGAVDLADADAVTGILGSANGGTGNGFTAFSGPASTAKTFTLPNASATILTTNAAVTVAQGGTGATTLTGILKGNGTSAFTAATAGTDYTSPSSTEIMTNKTIELAGNTVFGTLASFNTALTDADFVSIAGAETLTNKTLTAPKIANGGFIADGNGNEYLKFTQVSSAVNEFTISNNATGSSPSISATGGDANISINLLPKGTGYVNIVATTSNASGISLYEDLDNGSNTATIVAPTSLAGNVIHTLPSATTTLVGTDNAATFSNKTFALFVNTLTGTTAEFNAALSDNDFATLAGSESLTNKNLTSGTNTFPTFNQNTTGSAATLTTARDLYGFSFNGSAGTVSGTNIIASGYGGTGNGFTKFSGPATSEKTFTLPNASATILTTNTAVTVAQGGTGTTTLTGLVKGNGTSAFTAAVSGTDYQAPLSGGASNVLTKWTSSSAIGQSDITDDGTDVGFGNNTVSGFSAKYNTQTGTTYTLQSSDNGKIVTINNGSAITLTVPTSLPAGFTCTIVQLGAGQITFTASGTTILNAQSFTKTAAQYAMATILQTATANTFITQGYMSN